MVRKALLPSLFLAIVLPSAGALAQDEVASRILYDEGQKALAEGKVEVACAKFEESLRQKYSLNVQYYYGDCLEKQGRVVSSWLAFLQVASKARSAGEHAKLAQAQGRADALVPRLPRLKLDVHVETPGMEIRRNDTIVPKTMWDSAIPIDPGSITITVSAAGKKTWSGTFKLELGKVTTATIPALEASGDTSAPVASSVRPSASAAPSTAPAEALPPAHHSSSPLKPIGLLVGGLGFGGLVAAGVLGLVAKSTFDGSNAHCGPSIGMASDVCSASGLEQRQEAVNQGNVATALAIAGGALAIGGTVLFLVGSNTGNGDKAHASFVLTPSGIVLSGAF